MGNILRAVSAFLLSTLTVAFVAPAVSSTPNEVWADDFWTAGLNGPVVDAESDGLGNLFATGQFTAIDDSGFGHVAMWDGSSWSQLGDGLPWPGTAIAVNDEGDVFVASQEGVLSRWDGTAWLVIRADLDFQIANIEIDATGAPVIPAVDSETYDGINVERWTGSDWEVLGDRTPIDSFYPTYGLISSDDQGTLFRGSSLGVEAWQGTSWQTVGDGGPTGAFISQLKVANDGSIVAIQVAQTGIYHVESDIWRWDGTAWSNLGAASLGEAPIAAMGLSATGTILVAGGGVIAEVNDQGLTPTLVANGGSITNFEAFGDELVVMRQQRTPQGGVVPGIASWQPDTGFSPMHGSETGQGVEAYLRVATLGSDGTLIVGGSFREIAGTSANGVAQWDGTKWKAMGAGFASSVEGLVLVDDKIVALESGLLFEWAGVAKGWLPLDTAPEMYLGRVWSDNSGGLIGIEYDYNEEGEFQKIARLKDGAWTMHGSVDQLVDVVVAADGTMIAAGGTTDEGPEGVQVLVPQIMTWTATGWQRLDSNLRGIVRDLEVIDEGVIASGGFQIPGESTSSLALWDGNRWTAYGTQRNVVPTAIVKNPCGGLIVAGYSTTGYQGSLARWDGSAWQAFGAGLGFGSPQILLAHGQDVYAVGGDISTAGGMPSRGVAHWTEPGFGPIEGAESVREIVGACNYDADTQGDVLRLYRAFFNREPDVDGARYWIDVNSSGQPLDQIAEYFTLSQEFTNSYDNLSDAEYLAEVYTNVLGRDYDQAGFDYWLALLESDELSRGGVVRWVAANSEFIESYPYR